MNPLGERFFHTASTAVTKLGEFAAARGNFEQGAARACNGASEHLYKHPWGSQSHTLAVLFLPRCIRNLFEDDGGAHRDDLVDFAPVQALAMSCQLALFLSLATARLLVVLTAFPPEVLFSLLLDTTLLVIVLRIGRSPLPVHFALEPTES